MSALSVEEVRHLHGLQAAYVDALEKALAQLPNDQSLTKMLERGKWLLEKLDGARAGEIV